MKVGLFDHTDLIISKEHNLLMHKSSRISVSFIKTKNEEETIKNFVKAINELELRIGLYLINKL